LTIDDGPGHEAIIDESIEAIFRDFVKAEDAMVLETVGPGGERIDIGVTPADHVVDATGAGDQYAAGFIYGLSIGADMLRCGELGSIAAGEVISHVGARPHVELAQLIRAPHS
ncbi:MAG: PfkB family carbohydrate kinase, partial [Acidimicrobiales bacterium]